jgi:hypothetical protein
MVAGKVDWLGAQTAESKEQILVGWMAARLEVHSAEAMVSWRVSLKEE